MSDTPKIPATVETKSAEPIECDAMHLNTLAVDATARDAGPWTLSFDLIPYVAGDPNAEPPTPNRYSDTVQHYETKDANAAALNLYLAGRPAMAQALALIKDQCGKDVYFFLESRRPALIAATAAHDAAKAGVEVATEDVATADVARTAAFRALDGSPEKRAEYDAADLALTAARIALADAQAVAQAAAGRVAIAQAAVTDPANPPLTEAPE